MSENDAAAFIEACLKSANVGRRMKPERFQRQLVERFGNPAKEVLACIEDRANGNVSAPLWKLKNQGLDLSLWLAAQFDRDFYRHYFPVFDSVTQSSTVRSILDIGCDNGLLTCCYAKRLPNVTVTGIDSCPEAIDCANALALRLKVPNVTFRLADARSLSDSSNGQVDLVTATMVFHNIIEIPNMPSGWSLSSLQLPDHSAWLPALGEARRVLNPEGRFVSVERLTSATGVMWWSRAVSAAGFKIDWPSCELIAYGSSGDEHKLPLLVSTPGTDAVPSPEDALAFWTTPDLVGWAQKPIEGEPAEAFFESFRGAQLIWGIEGRLDEAGLLDRFEAWDAGAILLGYSRSNHGGRRLVIGPRHKREECISGVRKVWVNRGYDRLREYISVEERAQVL